MKNKIPLQWNVFYHNINKNQILTMNIFDHSGFTQDVAIALIKCNDKQTFSVELRRELMYYFWCKCEYEVIISSWPPNDKTPKIKTDIYTQVLNNFDIFVDYIWNKRNQLYMENGRLYYES